MSFSVLVKLVDAKRKKWQSKTCSKLQNIRLHLPFNFSRVFSSLRKQENGGKTPSCSETTVVVEIPNDLVEEILPYLPMKSLVRFKSVSKVWKSLIESERLAEKQLLQRQKEYEVLEEMKITFEWSIPRNFRTKYLSKYSGLDSNLCVAGSCNGVVCLYDLTNVYLVIPTTKMVQKLPTPKGGSKLSVGLGKDVVTGTYKVVIVYGFDYDDRVETVVYEVGSGREWRRRHDTAGPMPLSYTPFTLINPERNPVFANGSLFWLLTRYHSEILVMDLHTEKFSTLSHPEDIISNNVSLSSLSYMWSFEDRLCVSELRQGLDSDVWVLARDEVSERWERTKFPCLDAPIPPLQLKPTWYTKTLQSPYVEPPLIRSTTKTLLTMEAMLISEVVRSSSSRSLSFKSAGLLFESDQGLKRYFLLD